MNHSEKGFTLVELIGVVVILGILAVFALPVITRTLDSSRNKMYVNDAKRLVSHAEYKIKANSTKIDLPDNGDAIVLSLRYLEASSITDGPNGGKYDLDRSYVVVRRYSDNLEYAVCLLEHEKNSGFRGFVLIKNADLFQNDVAKKITGLNESQAMHVNNITKNYINGKVSNFITGTLTNVYK